VLEDFFKWDGLLFRITNLIWDVLLIGILWLLFSLPIITIGASTTAAYYAIMKTARKRYGYAGKEFFASFWKNLKPGILLGMFFYGITGVLMYLFLLGLLADKSVNQLYATLVGCAILFFAGFGVYLFPNLSRFQMNIATLIKLSIFMEFRYLFTTILSLGLWMFFVVMVWNIPWMIFLSGFVFYVLSYLIEPAIKKSMPKPEEGSKEAEIWYYK
jgi:uncharacterized membrane protein YesL